MGLDRGSGPGPTILSCGLLRLKRYNTSNNGVLVTSSGHVTTPDSVKANLKRAGEQLSRLGNLRYEHDLDARDTTIVRNRLHGRTLSPAERGRPEQLSSKYRAKVKAAQTQEKRRGGQNPGLDLTVEARTCCELEFLADSPARSAARTGRSRV